MTSRASAGSAAIAAEGPPGVDRPDHRDIDHQRPGDGADVAARDLAPGVGRGGAEAPLDGQEVIDRRVAGRAVGDHAEVGDAPPWRRDRRGRRRGRGGPPPRGRSRTCRKSSPSTIASWLSTIPSPAGGSQTAASSPLATTSRGSAAAARARAVSRRSSSASPTSARVGPPAPKGRREGGGGLLTAPNSNGGRGRPVDGRRLTAGHLPSRHRRSCDVRAPPVRVPAVDSPLQDRDIAFLDSQAITSA